MRKPVIVHAILLTLLFAAVAGADVGRFNSFSTTVTRTPGQLDFLMTVNTTGLVTPEPTTAYPGDYVIVYFGAMPTGTGTGTGSGTLSYILRTGLGPGAFARSFSLTGFDDGTNYKWFAMAVGNLQTTPTVSPYSGFYQVLFYLYFGCMPFPTTATTAAIITTPSGATHPLPNCNTITSPVGGPLYDFLASNVSTTNIVQNMWTQTATATAAVPVIGMGVAGGKAFALGQIPTLASLGLMIFGSLLAGTGVILLRRG